MSGLIAVIFLNLLCFGAADLLSEYDHFVALDPAEKMKLYWTVNNDSISFALEAETTGWVGLGFTPGTGRMAGADIIIGWVKDGKPYLTDRHGEGHSLPTMDDSQDYNLISGYEKDGKTTLKFSRKLDTCDKDDLKIEGGTTRVIFAYSNEDPITPNAMKMHIYKSARSMLLLNFQKQSQPDPSWQKMEFLMNNITIPSRKTSYSCQAFKMPKLGGKKHILRFDPVVEPGNEGFVHHFVVYECKNPMPGYLLNKTVECTDFANMPKEVSKCKEGEMLGAWGVGGGPFQFPDHVGFPVGMNDSQGVVLLEVHYDNPELIKDRVDSSGVRFYYTSNLRQYDAGAVNVGSAVVSWMVLPPKQRNWTVTSYCKKECTEEVLESSPLPEKGVMIFASFLHTHVAGRGIWTRHIRDGVQLQDIAGDDYYDFNFQEVQRLPKEIHFRPGDEMIHQCKYNTMTRDKTTFGGLETSDEMCLNIMWYYPRLSKFTSCDSTSIRGPYKFLAKHFPHMKPFAHRWYNPLLISKPVWTDNMTNDLKDFYEKDDKIIASCTEGDMNNIQYWLNPDNLADKTSIKKPYIPPPSCDVKSSSSPVLQVGVLSIVCAVAWILTH